MPRAIPEGHHYATIVDAHYAATPKGDHAIVVTVADDDGAVITDRITTKATMQRAIDLARAADVPTPGIATRESLEIFCAALARKSVCVLVLDAPLPVILDECALERVIDAHVTEFLHGMEPSESFSKFEIDLEDFIVFDARATPPESARTTYVAEYERTQER